MICEYQRKYAKNAVEGVEISCMWKSKNFGWFHHVFCRSLFAVRHWQKDWSTTRPWHTWNCVTARLVIPGPRLGVWWRWWRWWGTNHNWERYCSRDRDRANRRWNGELSERGAIQSIGAEMCQVHHADLGEFEFVLFIWDHMWVREEVWEECSRRHWDVFMWISKIRWFQRVFCKSCVRHWQKDWSTTRPWQTWIWLATTLVLPGLRLGVWWGCWGIGQEGERYCSRDRDRANRMWNCELSERKTTQSAEMCQVHHADLGEFELVLFISLQTTWYVSIRGSMRRMR